MLLTKITNQPILVNGCPQGICRGVGISLKTCAVKYLLCASKSTQTSPDFAIGISSIESLQNGIHLTKLRTVHPKTCAKIFIGAPVYSFEGACLGEVADLELDGFIASALITSRGKRFSTASLYACLDAVILKREQPYPLGQRIPAPLSSPVNYPKDTIVTKSILRNAIRQSALVKLTLSLPPFNVEL